MTAKSNTISIEQKMVLISYMESHPDLSRGKLKAKSRHEDFMRMWKEVTHQLNSCRSGPKKNLVYWRQTWNDMKKTTRAKILQRRTGGADGALVKLSPVQKRIAGLMCPFKSRCTISATNQDRIPSEFLEPQTCLDEGPANIPANGISVATEVHNPTFPVISKLTSNSLAFLKTEPTMSNYSISNGVEWTNSSEVDDNDGPESPEPKVEDHRATNNASVNNIVNSHCGHLINNSARVSLPDCAINDSASNVNCHSGNDKLQEQQLPHQGDSDKFFEYQRQSAEALSQLAESHRKMAEAALRTATAEERKASALEQLVALLT